MHQILINIFQIIQKSNKKGRKRQSESPEPSQNSSKSFQLSASHGSMPPLESSLGQDTSPVRNETFQSIQSSIQVSPSPKRKTPPKSPPKNKTKSPLKNKKSKKQKEPSSNEESENEVEQESEQESPVENKRKPKLTKASFQID